MLIKTVDSEDFQNYPEQVEIDYSEATSLPLVLSLHVMQGIQGHQTMRLSAQIDNVEVILLVDIGSTHKFIDFKLAKRLKFSLEVSYRLKVLTLGGESLFT